MHYLAALNIDYSRFRSRIKEKYFIRRFIIRKWHRERRARDNTTIRCLWQTINQFCFGVSYTNKTSSSSFSHSILKKILYVQLGNLLCQCQLRFFLRRRDMHSFPSLQLHDSKSSFLLTWCHHLKITLKTLWIIHLMRL